jgi:hypothetical protein
VLHLGHVHIATVVPADQHLGRGHRTGFYPEFCSLGAQGGPGSASCLPGDPGSGPVVKGPNSRPI